VRTIELLLLALLTLRLIIPLGSLRAWPAWWIAPSTVLVAVLALHGTIEGVRWNMALLYLVALTVIARDLWFRVRPRPIPSASLPTRWLTRSAGVIVLGVATLPGWLLPVPDLPAPTGPFAVGTDAIEVALPDDVPRAAPGFDRARARLWYPANTVENTAAHHCGDTWLEHEATMLPALAQRAGLPGFTLQHLAHVRTHACWGVPAAGDGAFPVLTFNHGRGGFAAQNTFLAEELASHGWLVVSLDHPGGAVLSVFQDGETIPFDDPSFGGGLEGPAYDDAIRTLGERWIAETRTVLDALERGEGPATLIGRTDRNRLVTSGHSTGGGSAFGLCAVEPGCVATVGLDPWMLPMPPALLDTGLGVPVTALFSDPALEFFEPANRQAFNRLAAASQARGADTHAETYPGAGHMDVTDVALLSPIADRLGLYVGPAPGREVLTMVRRDVLDVLGSTGTLPMGR